MPEDYTALASQFGLTKDQLLSLFETEEDLIKECDWEGCPSYQPYESWEDQPAAIELCPDCPAHRALSVEDARLMLNRRLIDCGWKRPKIDRYLNAHLPLHGT